MIPQKMESRITLMFDKLYIPLINLNEFIIDLSYEDKTIRFDYPQKEEQIVSLADIASIDREIIKVTIMIIVGKKYKKLAKGNFTVSQKSFAGDKKKQQKTIELTLFTKHFENIGHKIETINAEKTLGKIQIEYTCLDTINQKIGKETTQTKHAQLKKSKSKTANELNKIEEPEIELKREELFDDDLSDHSISIIDLIDDEDNDMPLIAVASGENVEQFANLFNENVLPKDCNQLKELNHSLFTECKKLTEEYEKSLTALNSTNERIRVQAKNCYEKYKETKKIVYKERVALKEKTMNNNELSEVNQANSDKNMQEIRKYKNDFNYLARQINNSDTSTSNIDDVTSMTDILKNMHRLGFDIFVGLSKEQKNELSALIHIDENQQIEEQPKKLEEEDLQSMREDIELGNTIVSLIERVANELFPKNAIGNIKIDQINAITYKFDYENISKEVTLKIGEDEVLFTETGETFISWLIKYFGKKTK